MDTDTVKTAGGDLTITFVGHGTLMFGWQGKTIHVDPFSREADYTRMPKADLILITHEHRDHLDPAALAAVRKEKTVVVLPPKCASVVAGGTVLRNGETLTAAGLKIEAVPAYNILSKRGNGEPYHTRGDGNGYVLTFADKRLYIAGDTENVPEVKALKDIDIAFLPMNMPYTMPPALVADAARAIRPKILYPYHYGDTDPAELTRLLADEPRIEVRIRRMK